MILIIAEREMTLSSLRDFWILEDLGTSFFDSLHPLVAPLADMRRFRTAGAIPFSSQLLLAIWKSCPEDFL
jgi:hypothetical protein